MRSPLRASAAIAAVILAMGPACRRAPAPSPDVVALRVTALPDSPADAAWGEAPEHLAKLIPQDLVEPRLMTPSTGEVRVRALTDGARVAFRLEWADASRNDRPGPSQMVDACAVQIPQKLETEPPAPQMGEAGKLVDVTYWRADWQASVDGRGDTIRDLYPNAAIDHYPFDAQSLEKGSPEQAEMAKRYAPARALGNARSGPRATPVEDLVASGPSTLTRVEPQGSRGKGVFGQAGWSVVIVRAWPKEVVEGRRTNIAFAVWQGDRNEVGARKMRTGWIPLLARAAQ